MKTTERLRFAIEAMKQANTGHCHEIFMDIELDEEDETIRFNILCSDSLYPMGLAKFLNMTYWPEPKGDKIQHSITP